MPVGLRQYGDVVDAFLVEIGEKPSARVLYLLRMLAQLGGAMRNDSKPLQVDGLFELTVKHDKMEYRLIYAFDRGSAVFLKCFIKRSRKTPKGEIDSARDRLKLLQTQSHRFNGVQTN